MSKILIVRCPDCDSELHIDAASGVVLEHQAPARAKADLDLTRASEQLQQQERARNARFEQSVAAEKQRDRLLEHKFEENLRRARQSPNERPLRDFDLD